MNTLLDIVKSLAKPLLGKGIIDKHLPIVIPLFQRVYAHLQTDTIKEVAIPLDSRLNVFAKDIGVGLPLILKGEYEKTLTTLFLTTVKAGDVVFDIGSNVGYYTVLSGKKVNATGKVYAFEPDKENAELLKKNIKLNKLSNVTSLPQAVSNKNETISFAYDDHNKGESSIAYIDSQASYNVEATTLDSFCNKYKIHKINVMKIDIEGAEVLALQGATEIVNKQKSLKLFIECNPSSLKHFGFSEVEFLKALDELGFRVQLIIDEATKSIFPYSSKNLYTVFSHTTYCNLYCTKGI